jgi:hypothetical protein
VCSGESGALANAGVVEQKLHINFCYEHQRRDYSDKREIRSFIFENGASLNGDQSGVFIVGTGAADWE